MDMSIVYVFLLAYLPVLLKQIDDAWKAYQKGTAFSFCLFIKTAVLSLFSTLVMLQFIRVEDVAQITQLIEVMLTSTVITMPIDGILNRLLKKYFEKGK